MKLIVASTALTVAASLPLYGAGQHPDAMRASLRGVDQISVVVHFEPDALAKGRLSPNDSESMQVLGRVEQKLRRSGLAANPQMFTDPRPTSLEVGVDVKCSELVPVCGVGVSVRLAQWATVTRSGQSVLATTWHNEHTTVLSFEKMTTVFTGLDEILDRLVADWQAVNKKLP